MSRNNDLHIIESMAQARESPKKKAKVGTGKKKNRQKKARIMSVSQYVCNLTTFMCWLSDRSCPV